MKISEIFGESRIIGFAGEKNVGKTNNLIALIKDFRKYNKTTQIYFFGLEESVVNWLKIHIKNCFEVSTLEQLSNKRDSIIILDEFQKLNLNDRRYKELLNQFINFIYHKNNRLILCSPSLREFNSIIGGKIEKWILKSVKLNNLINGSQLKNIILNYKGRYKSINDLVIPKGEILVINDVFEQIIKLDYIKQADSKINQKNIFVKELSNKNVNKEKLIHKNVEKSKTKEKPDNFHKIDNQQEEIKQDKINVTPSVSLKATRYPETSPDADFYNLNKEVN